MIHIVRSSVVQTSTIPLVIPLVRRVFRDGADCLPSVDAMASSYKPQGSNTERTPPTDFQISRWKQRHPAQRRGDCASRQRHVARDVACSTGRRAASVLRASSVYGIPNILSSFYPRTTNTEHKYSVG